MVLTGVLSKMGVYGFVRLLLPLFPNEIKILGPWLLGLAVCSIVFASLAAWAQSDLKRMVAYLSINHLGYCMLGLFAVTASPIVAARIDTHAALSGVFMQIFNHGITAAALFYYVGLLEQRRGLRGINDFGGLMQRTPLLCGWMSVAMFSSLGLPGLNGFIGEFLIFKGSFATAASFTAVAVIGLLVTAIAFSRAHASALQRSAGRELQRVSRSSAKRESSSSFRSRCSCSPSASRRSSSSTSSTQPSFTWRACLPEGTRMSKEIIPIDRIAHRIHLLRGQKVMLDFDLAALYGVATKVLNQAVKRNRGRFPDDFMFQLSAGETANLKSQFVISSSQDVVDKRFLKNRSQIVTGPLKHRELRSRPYRLHRTRRGHAFERSKQRARGKSQHRDHARVCETARDARNKSRARAKIFGARKTRRETR